MNHVIIKSSQMLGHLSLSPGKPVQISVVAYEHLAGMPARFYAGLIPAIDVFRQLTKAHFDPVIRVVDPTQIAYYCNGWRLHKSPFQPVVTEFFTKHGVSFFFDEAEEVGSGSLEVLGTLKAELETCSNRDVNEIVCRIKESGRKHGGETGERNATLYMSAHPFSWLDMHHPSLWEKHYPADDFHFVNLMSPSEDRFKVVRDYLQTKRPDLRTNSNPSDRYTINCNTPCYIPLEKEPKLVDLIQHGPAWCERKYDDLSSEDPKYKRAHTDFLSVVPFLT